MGLTPSFLRQLARWHRAKPLPGPVLTLGRQAVYATFDDVQKIWREEGISVQPLAAGQSTVTNIPGWKNSLNATYTNDAAVFRTLAGLDVYAMDNSDYEGADYLCNLNQPIPGELEGKFGLVIDAGTLEHVFDVKQALHNINRVLRHDGRVIHSSPASNWLEHGFFQFSPSLFFDYYGVNKFANLECFLVEVTRANVARNYQMRCDYWRWNVRRPSESVMSEEALHLIFTAEKTADSTVDVVPQQGEFESHGEGGRLGEGRLSTLEDLARRWLPAPAKALVKRAIGRDFSIKPWGLTYLGKI